jgi:hypothetical protein
MYAKVGGLGEEGTEKDLQLGKRIRDSDAVIFGLVEVIINWWHAGSQTLFERSSRWLQGSSSAKHVSFAHNGNYEHAPTYEI